MGPPIILALILSLLVASGCAVSSQQMLGSSNFVAEHLPELLSLEKESDGVMTQLQMLVFVGLDPAEDLEEMQGYFDTYWVYYHAVNVYLSDGNRDLFVQAVARAKQALQKIRDVITEILDSSDVPESEIKPETLSL